jgi:hypothetical protein
LAAQGTQHVLVARTRPTESHCKRTGTAQSVQGLSLHRRHPCSMKPTNRRPGSRLNNSQCSRPKPPAQSPLQSLSSVSHTKLITLTPGCNPRPISLLKRLSSGLVRRIMCFHSVSLGGRSPNLSQSHPEIRKCGAKRTKELKCELNNFCSLFSSANILLQQDLRAPSPDQSRINKFISATEPRQPEQPSSVLSMALSPAAKFLDPQSDSYTAYSRQRPAAVFSAAFLSASLQVQRLRLKVTFSDLH